MPFRSKAQARYMFSQKPKLAKEFAAKTPSIKALPNKAKKFTGKGTRARLNTAAAKSFFGGKAASTIR